MKNRGYKIICAVSLLLLPSILWAQSFFGFGAKAAEDTSTASASSNTPQVMSPQEFKNRVNTLSQKTKDDLGKEVTQQLSNRQIVPSSLPQTSPQTTDQAAPDVTVDTTGPAAAAPAGTPAFTPPPGGQMSTQQTATQSSSQQGLKMPTPAAAPAQSTQQVYTGFGSTNTKNRSSTTSNSGSSTGGWNIKY